MTWDDWVKILALIGSIVLAYGSMDLWILAGTGLDQAEIREDAVREASAEGRVLAAGYFAVGAADVLNRISKAKSLSTRGCSVHCTDRVDIAAADCGYSRLAPTYDAS